MVKLNDFDFLWVVNSFNPTAAADSADTNGYSPVGRTEHLVIEVD